MRGKRRRQQRDDDDDDDDGASSSSAAVVARRRPAAPEASEVPEPPEWREARLVAMQHWVEATLAADGGGAAPPAPDDPAESLEDERERAKARDQARATTERRQAALLHYHGPAAAAQDPDVLLAAVRTWVAQLRTPRGAGLARALKALARAAPFFAPQYRLAYLAAPPGQAAGVELWDGAPDTMAPGAAAATLRLWFWEDNGRAEAMETNTYPLVKLRHEREYFKIRSPSGYVFVDAKKRATGDLDVLSRASLVDVCCEETYWARNEETQEHEERNFIRDWLRDKGKRCVRCFVSKPAQDHAHDEYNLWPLPEAEALPPVPDREVDELVRPTLEHVRDVLAGGNPALYEYILAWMAFLVQMPHMRTGTILLFFGEQGVGKDIVWDFLMRCVLGRRLAFQTANVQRDLFGQFSAGLANRKLIICDEIGNMRALDSAIKNIVTAPVLNLEKKNVNPVTLENYACMVATTNNLDTIHVSSSDRRVVAIEVSAARRGDAPYFEALLRQQARPEAARAMLQFLKGRVDLTPYAWEGAFQQRRPETEFYRELQQQCLSLEDRYLSAVVNQYLHQPAADAEAPPLPVVERDAKAVHLRYKEMGEFEPRDNVPILNQSNFGRNIRKRASIAVHKTCRGKSYRIDIDALHKELLRARRYDAEAALQTPL